MKKYINIAFSLVALIALSSCSEDFITVYPNEFVSVEKIEESAENDPELIAGQLNGIYTTMITTGTGGTTNHTDFGHKSYDLYGDILSGDLALTVNTYNWYYNVSALLTTVDYTVTGGNYEAWRYFYRIIRSANFLIASAGGNDFVPEDEELGQLIGQAKAMRAYAYFYLAQYYVDNGYVPGEPALPLYLDPETTAQPLSTNQEVYAQIIKDLNDAVSLLANFDRSSKNQIDMYVAKALLAYTYGAMGEDEMVADLTSEIISDGGYTLMSGTEVLGGFNDVATAGWMWGQDLTLDNGLDLVSWWGQVDIYTYSYGAFGDVKAIDEDLYNAIPATDVRKGQFLTQAEIDATDGLSDIWLLTPSNKFYDPARIPFSQRNVITDYVYMRVAEMYLLNAEANAKIGRDALAQQSLKALVSERVPDASYIDGLSGDQLLKEIILQTRIELLGEGKSYLSVKRNKLNVVRGANHLTNVGVSIPYNDDRLTFEIPQSEVLNNPNID